MAEPEPKQLYVIVWGAYLKVGCSVDPIDRLTRVTERGSRPPRQRGQPELIGTVHGGFGAEAWLHAVLTAHRAAGEWYHLRGPVLELAAAASRRGLVDLERPTKARRRRAVLGPVPAGSALVAVSAVRSESADAWRHAALLPAALLAESVLPTPVRAICGTHGRRVHGPFVPGSDRACGRCLRALGPAGPVPSEES